MASKSFNLNGIGLVTIYKRRGVKRLNLRLSGDKVRVTQPVWLPYSSGVRFSLHNKQWILQQFKNLPDLVIKNGMSIGKKRLLRFEPGATLRSRITDTAVIVVLPPNLPSYSDPAQLSAKKAIRRSLKKEADECLPIRLSAMAARYDFAYNNLKNKSMHSRWGSCTNRGDITLSIYLMMMPWEMIDYVLLHELVHTRHLHHAQPFWQTMSDIMPDYKERRKALKELQPLVAPLK